MKRDPDIVRSILLWIEANEQFDGWSKRLQERPEDNTSPLEGIDWKAFYYNLRQCELSDLIISNTSDHPHKVTVTGLTPAGHEFIEAFRKQDVWNRVKAASENAGGFSFRFFVSIGQSIVRKKIEKVIAEYDLLD